MSAFRLVNVWKVTILELSSILMSMHAWNSVCQQKTATGQLTSETLVFASCCTTAQAWMLKNVLTVLAVQLIALHHLCSAGSR